MSRPSELNDPSCIQVVALVLEDSQGNVLLTQRQHDKHLASYWEFPGGKVEANESLTTALLREIKEELNYHPPELAYLISVTHQYPEKKVQIHFYHCCDHVAKPTPMEQQAMQWVPKSLLSTTKIPPANLPVLKVIY